ncbi:MAG TPA: hypothetical protein VJ352_11960 [Geodermatophilus sp.]|nr:hypothetical protein [Geodermatophilus sp.]
MTVPHVVAGVLVRGSAAGARRPARAHPSCADLVDRVTGALPD